VLARMLRSVGPGSPSPAELDLAVVAVADGAGEPVSARD
jgi:hypothetical protein